MLILGWVLAFLCGSIGSFVAHLTLEQNRMLREQMQRSLERDAPIMLIEMTAITYNIFTSQTDDAAVAENPAPNSSVVYPSGFLVDQQYSALPQFDRDMHLDAEAELGPARAGYQWSPGMPVFAGDSARAIGAVVSAIVVCVAVLYATADRPARQGGQPRGRQPRETEDAEPQAPSPDPSRQR